MVGHYRKANVSNIKPGIKNVAYLAKVSDFTSLEVPDPAATTAVGKLTIATDHTFGAGKGFQEVTLVRKKNQATAEMKGDSGAGWLDYSVQMVVPGDGALAQALIQDLMNEDLILLVKEVNCPVVGFVQYGCDCSNGEIDEVKFDSGMEGGDSGKNWAITLKTTCRSFYEGTLTLQT
jgi:hypothetical protein